MDFQSKTTLMSVLNDGSFLYPSYCLVKSGLPALGPSFGFWYAEKGQCQQRQKWSCHFRQKKEHLFLRKMRRQQWFCIAYVFLAFYILLVEVTHLEKK